MKVLKQKSLTFTPTLFFKYAICPHWLWHDFFSDPKNKGEKIQKIPINF